MTRYDDSDKPCQSIEVHLAIHWWRYHHIRLSFYSIRARKCHFISSLHYPNSPATKTKWYFYDFSRTLSVTYRFDNVDVDELEIAESDLILLQLHILINKYTSYSHIRFHWIRGDEEKKLLRLINFCTSLSSSASWLLPPEWRNRLWCNFFEIHIFFNLHICVLFI